MKEMTRAARWPAAAVVWSALALLLLSGIYPTAIHAAEKFQHLVNCDLHNGACTQQLDGTDVRLEVTPRPVEAMTDLLFKVTLIGEQLSLKKNPFIDLGMPGMNMGPNRVLLKASGPSTYEGQGVIVRCKSGRKIWQATVTLPDTGAVRFVFHVIY